jgi:hypothetical protein
VSSDISPARIATEAVDAPHPLASLYSSTHCVYYTHNLLLPPRAASCCATCSRPGLYLVRLILSGCRTMQDEIHKRHKHGSALQMMCWMNFW